MKLYGLQKILEIFAFFLTWTIVHGRLITAPENQDTVVGERIRFSCSTDQPYSVNWQHVRTGRQTADDVYLSRRVVHPYHPRVTVERTRIGSNVTHYDLVISSAKREDAGTFRCRDEAGQGQLESAQLTVLESLPNCVTNIGSGGLIGDNDCGIDTETIRCSCHLKYAGDIAPEMRWTTSQGNVLRSTDDRTTNGSLSSDLQLKVGISLNGTEIVWYSERSPHIKWTSSKIKILYAMNNLSTVVVDHKESVSCLANSSENCSYRWIARLAPTYEPMIFEKRTLSVDAPGTYLCEARCMLRDVPCTVISLHAESKYAENRNGTAMFLGILVPTCIFIIFILFALLLAIFARHRRKNVKELDEKVKLESVPLHRAGASRSGAPCNFAFGAPRSDRLFPRRYTLTT